MKEIEHKILDNVKEVAYDSNKEISFENETDTEMILDEKELKYFNEYGGFTKTEKNIK